MNGFLNKTSIPLSVTQRNKFNLSTEHVTTNDFFRLKPVYIHEMVPGEEININMGHFVRTMPLQKPFFGNVQFINRAFFVPMRTVMADFQEFITNVPRSGAYGSTQKDTHVPLVRNHTMVSLFTDYDDYAVEASSSEAFDFCVPSSTNMVKYRYTTKGKVAYDILRNLGYHPNFANKAQDTDTYSALPLLAFVKIYNDWLRNSAYGAGYQIQCKYKGTEEISVSNLNQIFNKINYSLYEKDYFTTAWVRPSQPNTVNGSSSVMFGDITNDKTNDSSSTYSVVRSGSSPESNYPTTPSIATGNKNGSAVNSNGVTSLTQYALDRLKQLTDYAKRFQLVGDRVIDRFAAMFGITLPTAKLDISNYLGMFKFNLNIGEVMSTADTTNEGLVTNVGDYAGKGNGFGQGHFSFKTDEFGYLIIISVVRPHIGYVQGRPRFISHVNRLDFFTPDFDSGVQPIRQDELFADFFEETNTDYNAHGSFGFTSQYAEYKTQPHHGLSGDFVLLSKNNVGGNNMNLFRLFNESDDFHVDEAFTIGDNTQYDRVFNITDGIDDQFQSYYHFEVSAWLPMAKMFDDYEFDGGKAMTHQIGGTVLD